MYVCVVLCVVCCVCCVWLIPDPLPTKVTWATEARRCSVSSHGKCRTGIPLVCMRRRGGATMRACRSRTSIASYGKLQTQIFFTQRPSQAPADSRVPTSGAVLQVPQRHLSNWTQLQRCQIAGHLVCVVLVCLSWCVSWCVRVNVCVCVVRAIATRPQVNG